MSGRTREKDPFETTEEILFALWFMAWVVRVVMPPKRPES